MTIRPAREEDYARIGELGELLVRTHHDWNASRFLPVERMPGSVYTARVREELARGHGTVLVAEIDGQIAGYVFAGVEPESWKEIRPEAGYVHDLVVDEGHRRGGIGTALLNAAVEWFRARGIGRVMLWTAPQNERAQRLFKRAGFQATMLEMMLDG